MNPKMRAAFDRSAASTFDKQLYLDETVGDKSAWQFETATGILRIGYRQQWQAQILGTESDESGTWQWGWANQPGTFPDKLLGLANSLRKLGRDKQIDELCQPKLPLSKYSSTFLSTLATGVCKADAFFRDPHEDGAVILLIKDPSFRPKIENPLDRLVKVFPMAVSTSSIDNHRLALTGYAEFLGLETESAEGGMILFDESGGEVAARFDAKNRLTSLKASIDTQTKPVAPVRVQKERKRDAGRPASNQTEFQKLFNHFEQLYAHFFKLQLQLPQYLAGVVAFSLFVTWFTWMVASLPTALIVGFIVFIITYFLSFIPLSAETHLEWLKRPGRVSIWTCSSGSVEAIERYVKRRHHGFREEVGFGPIEEYFLETGPSQPSLEESIRRSSRGKSISPDLGKAIARLDGDVGKSYIAYYGIDYTQLVVENFTPDDALVKFLGTFQFKGD